MSRSQRHLREIQGYDSAGQSEGAGGIINPDAGAIKFTGSIIGGVGNVGVPYSLLLAGNFSGSDLPFTYTLQSGTLPSGTTLNASTGEISGTPDTITDYTGIIVRCTDNSGDFADTNTFAIDIQA